MKLFTQYVFQYFIPGIALIFLGFYSGTHPQILFALIGFLSFFVVGITLIIEGWAKLKKR